jgi:hypothetical protein
VLFLIQQSFVKKYLTAPCLYAIVCSRLSKRAELLGVNSKLIFKPPGSKASGFFSFSTPLKHGPKGFYGKFGFQSENNGFLKTQHFYRYRFAYYSKIGAGKKHSYELTVWAIMPT